MPTFPAQITRQRLSTGYRRTIMSLVLLLTASSSGLHAQTPAPLTIAGPTEVRLGGSATYSALVHGAPATVVWSVNGYAGGIASTGTISSSGVYSPASTIFAGHSVTVSAATHTTPVSSASLSVKVLNPLPIVSTGSITQTAPGTSYLLDLHGSNFVSGSQLQLAGANVATSFLSSAELQSTVSLGAGTASVSVGARNPNAAQASAVSLTLAVQTFPLVSLAEAARLLDQTTFGPTLATVQHVQQVGMAAYLNEQFAIPTTRMPAIPDPPVALCPDATFRCAQSAFWKNALTANDQLRQRVAFALSEIFVVSTDMVNARTIPSYGNLLADNAFGNFRQIIDDVATSPAMGEYLNMLDSAAPATGEIANENFARELMQLFTTGLYLLNADGSLQLDAQGKPQRVYTELRGHAYARALTGWTYANSTGGVPTRFPNGMPNYDQPMQPVASAHDLSAKALLND